MRPFSLSIWLGLLLIAVPAFSGPRFPDPLGYVSDYGRVLDDHWRARIRSVAQDLERKAGVEMVIVTVPDTEGFPSADAYAAELYRRWGIGTTLQQRGIVLLATVADRQVAIAVGSALTQRLSTDTRQQLIARYLPPMARSLQHGEGLYRLSVALAIAAQQEEPDARGRTGRKPFGIMLMVVSSCGALAFLWWISRPDLRHPYGRLRRGEYWGTGQGGYGGNFGGFAGATSGEGLK